MRFATLLAGTLLAGCSGASGTPAEPEPTGEEQPVTTPEAEADDVPPIPLAAGADLEGALGKLVEVTGLVQREKPGDSIKGADFDLLCPDFRFADEQVGQTLTVQGTLGEMTMPVAEVGPKGEISQWTTTPTTRWILTSCQAK